MVRLAEMQPQDYSDELPFLDLLFSKNKSCFQQSIDQLWHCMLWELPYTQRKRDAISQSGGLDANCLRASLFRNVRRATVFLALGEKQQVSAAFVSTPSNFNIYFQDMIMFKH